MTDSTDGPPSRSSSRVRAPTVAPIVDQGVRYEPLAAASSEGLPPGVYLMATAVGTGQRQWTTKLWGTTFDGKREADVQNVFIRHLSLDAKKGLLLVEDEKGRRAQVDAQTGQLRPAD